MYKYLNRSPKVQETKIHDASERERGKQFANQLHTVNLLSTGFKKDFKTSTTYMRGILITKRQCCKKSFVHKEYCEKSLHKEYCEKNSS